MSSESKSRKTTRILVAIALVWAIVVVAVLVWQAVTYTGFFAFLAEWQFRHWDRMFPIATIALVTGLLSLPFIVLLIVRMRRRRKHYGRLEPKAVRTRDTRIVRGLGVLIGACALGALLLAIAGLSIGNLTDKPRNMTPADVPSDGAAWVNMRGSVRYDRIGYYRERFLFFGRDLYVAPLVSANGSAPLKYFVEIPPRSRGSEAESRTVTGIMRRASLPGGLERLYRNEGLRIDNPTYVIFSERTSARWPFLSAAGDLMLLALLAAIGLILIRFHMRSEDRREPVAEAS